MIRQPLTTTHPHGYVLARRDRQLALLRISKNASTESKNRLECADWVAFDAFEGPVVAFLREPVSRFLSSVPETALRMTHFAIAEDWRGDRVVVPEDIFGELLGVAQEPIGTVMEKFIELVEYGFFDAHHEPQYAFMVDRAMQLRIDPLLYLTEGFENAITQIEIRTGIRTPVARERGNQGGAKPQAGRTPIIDFARRISRTGVYREVAHSGFLGQRYIGVPGPLTLRDLNGLANQFSRELKGFTLPQHLRERILALYAPDQAMWSAVTARGGDVRASEVWAQLA